MKKKLLINGQETLITIHRLTPKEISLSIDGTTHNYLRMNADTQACEMALRDRNINHLFPWHAGRGVIDGQDITVEEISPMKAQTSPMGKADNDEICSPMPGKILQIHAQKGDAVEEGQVLAVMEAMKMEHSIKSPRKGIISTLQGKPGDRVEGGAVIIKLESRS